MTRGKLYAIVMFASVAGYCWLLWSFTSFAKHSHTISVCLFKNITGIPCPSCGITHALYFIATGHIGAAIATNSLAFVAAIMLIICPLMTGYDMLFKKEYFLVTFLKIERVVTKKAIAIPAILLVLIVWFNNIYNCI